MNMRKTVAFLILSSIMFSNCKKDKTEPVFEMSDVRGYKDWFIGTFRCGLFVPPSYDNTKKYPLIIFLHGHTDTTTWNLGWYNEPIVSKDPCIVLTPKCPVEEIYGWGDSFHEETSPMMAKTYEMIDLVEKAFNLDQDRYYINGTSMGGYGTYGVLQKNPDMFAAAYVECGEPNIAIAPLLVNTPLWIFHGSADLIVPVQPDRDLYQAILNLGGTQIRYTEYSGVGHNVWDYVPNETTLPTWLLAQRKGSVHVAPANVTNFQGELIAANKVSLQWLVPDESAQSEDNKVWYCKIYRNGLVIKEVYNNLNNFIDSTIVAGNIYEYKISSVNYYFKEAVQSEGISFDLSK
jgi:poly(3-hydroxybutyrate) depolymerase